MKSWHKGLGGQWGQVVEGIARLASIGCYERINIVTSLGLSRVLRRKAARLTGCPPLILDLGCGPGHSTNAIREVCPASRVISVDPHRDMLYMHDGVNPTGVRITARGEKMPFANDSIDAIVAMFSWRDALDYENWYSEASRILKRDRGVFIVLDIYRPRQRLVKDVIKAYMRIGGVLASLLTACPKAAWYYPRIADTMDSVLSPSEAVDLARKYFKEVEYIGVPFLGIIVARRPSRAG